MIRPSFIDKDEGDRRGGTRNAYKLTTDELANQLAVAFDSSAEEFRSFAEAINCLSDDNPRRTQLGELIEKGWERLAGLVVVAALIAGGGMLLMHNGVYGLALFVMVPVIIGALAECFRKSATSIDAAKIGALTLAIANISLLALGMEGLICIAMSLPLTVPLGVMGALFIHAARRSRVPGKGTAAFLLLLPLSVGSLGFDLTAKPTVFEVRTSIEIAALPEQVWKYVVSFPEMAPPKEWSFKAGVAYPERADISGSGMGATRYCVLSTGQLVEPITIWDEPRLLQFRVTDGPASMHEWSPYAAVTPKHLHGYLLSKQGQFRLTPLANGHTLLEGTSWYQHGLWPSVGNHRVVRS